MKLKTWNLVWLVLLLVLAQGCLVGMEGQEPAIYNPSASAQTSPASNVRLQKKSSALFDKAILCGLSSNRGEECYCPDMSQSYGNMFCDADGRNNRHNRRCWSGVCRCGPNGCSLECTRCKKSSSTSPKEVDAPGGGKTL